VVRVNDGAINGDINGATYVVAGRTLIRVNDVLNGDTYVVRVTDELNVGAKYGVAIVVRVTEGYKVGVTHVTVSVTGGNAGSEMYVSVMIGAPGTRDGLYDL